MKNKNKIIIAGLVIFCIVILVISLIVFNKEDKNDNTNDKNSEYKEIKIENQNKLYDTSEVSMDLNSDGTKENIKIIEGTASIEINNTKYLDNAKEGYSYQYLIIDLNFDGNLEIIQREMRVTVSPISSSYRVYSYKNNNLTEIGSFNITGNLPDTIYSNGDTIKFEYWPYETPDDYKEEVVVNLSK